MGIMSKDVDEAKRASRFSRGCLQWLIGTYIYVRICRFVCTIREEENQESDGCLAALRRLFHGKTLLMKVA